MLPEMSSLLHASKNFAKHLHPLKPPENIEQKVTAPYQYRDLKSEGEIRLLTILPGDLGGPICLRIGHVAFDPPEEEEIHPAWSIERAIQEHLPNGWFVFEKANGQFVFGTDDRTFKDPPNAAELEARRL